MLLEDFNKIFKYLAEIFAGVSIHPLIAKEETMA